MSDGVASSSQRTVAIIVAAGRGVRAGGGLPKQYRQVRGAPALRHTVQAFLAHPAVDDVLVMIHPDDRALYDGAVGDLALLEPVAGGGSRQASVLNGLEALGEMNEAGRPDFVLIHDAARAFVDAGTISRVIDSVAATGDGAIPALPVADTLKRGDGDRVSATVDRAGLWRAQTPQGFPFAAILEAHRAVKGQNLTDDAAVAEVAGLAVRIVEGAESNIKLTRPEDFILAEAEVKDETRQLIYSYSTGFGYDVHRFCAGNELMLCGIAVPHDRSLAGHSDADVALHALTDALLGAIGEGDIGDHFPPSDPEWKGAPSHRFLSHAMELVLQRGGAIQNVDVTIICEAPKIGPHRQAMRARIAEILDIALDRVSVKATTTEKLGFAGRGEGIAAQAVATVALPPGEEA